MNARQLCVTAILGLLMLGTILLMPAHFPGDPTYSASMVRQRGVVAQRPPVPSELPPEQVRYTTYN